MSWSSVMVNREQSTILDSITEGVFTVGLDWRITSFNKAAENITGIPREQAIGERCNDILRADLCESDCALRSTIETGRPIINKPVHIVDAQGRKKAISISTALLQDEAGNVIGGVETFRDISLVEKLRKELTRRYEFEDMLSNNCVMEDLFRILPNVADSNATVLVEGESGTGKELLARAIHSVGSRRREPFVAVSCGAIPDTLLESELFGYKAGAFTDARKDKPGRFALAEGGTLFLDEIADVSRAVQVKLLRVLQEKIYEPLGATESVKTDVRIITATNKNLDELVSSGQFRQDLFYRINVVRLKLPPLRERKEDIPMLVEHFISRFNSVHDRNIGGATNEVLGILLSYDFPGNIRELENIVEHCFVLCGGEIIERKHLPGYLKERAGEGSIGISEGMTLEEMEKVVITDALRRTEGNKSGAARQLGIHKTTLLRKLRKYGIGTD